MNIKTAKILCTLTGDFYRDNAASFSQTRSTAWPGWTRCVEALTEHGLRLNRATMEHDSLDHMLSPISEGSQLEPIIAVFDLACGNLRFESFLNSKFPDTRFAFFAVDNCAVMVPATPVVDFQCLDVLEALFSDRNIGNRLVAPLCGLSVSFGFLHHVPMHEYRVKILESLIRQTCSGGFVIISLWQFLNNEKLAEKAEATHRRALLELGLPELDTGDYLLGWKDIPNQYRYCHSFSETEVDLLIDALSDKTTVVSRFVSDGRGNNLNAYLILKVK